MLLLNDIGHTKVYIKRDTTESSNAFTVQRVSKDNRKSLTARVKPDDIVVFNQRLKLSGFNSINELVREFIAGRFSQITEDKQIGNLVQNTQSNGQRTVLDGDSNYGSFYQNVDLENMFNYYQNIINLHPKTCRDLIGYFRRFRDQFFSKQKN
ncbi:MAG TPA: hypothetical protein VFY68_16960 [Nitrososphaeraceae archaeon]|nr:hypothetical protein [Nitrososphaeraceae archaeon]